LNKFKITSLWQVNKRLNPFFWIKPFLFLKLPLSRDRQVHRLIRQFNFMLLELDLQQQVSSLSR